ncbi:hypothetical protein EDD68_11230 [Melghiribacillus thermohalophilus]|uniref:Uncharacterized protein n=1 Tax=Melghiribacillus thermohalophilus TaxID=1324956 RepID=A0A4V2V1E4_9BACI|nr:hypothetical protein [Melghiribacillus thermohalophilus]TCT20902.1 hypothetical protein EDD68_11230 [Melghiribacillus thermohalophilus]
MSKVEPAGAEDLWNDNPNPLYTEKDIGSTRLHNSFRAELRPNFSEKEYNKFVRLNTVRDWSLLTWDEWCGGRGAID